MYMLFLSVLSLFVSSPLFGYSFVFYLLIFIVFCSAM